MRRSSTLVLTCVLLAGCSSPGVLVLRQDVDAKAVVGRAPADGTYQLFIAGEGQPLLEYPLKRDQALGFDRATTPAASEMQVQMLYGIAGTSRVRLDIRQTYEWRRRG